MSIQRAFLVKSPWADKILAGQKQWEIRGSATRQRGWVGLIESGTGHIQGAVRIDDSRGPLNREEFVGQVAKHHVQLDPEDPLPYDAPHAWVIGQALRFEQPIPYDHPQGAVIWVRLDDRTGQQVQQQIHQLQSAQAPPDRSR